MLSTAIKSFSRYVNTSCRSGCSLIQHFIFVINTMALYAKITKFLNNMCFQRHWQACATSYIDLRRALFQNLNPRVHSECKTLATKNAFAAISTPHAEKTVIKKQVPVLVSLVQIFVAVFYKTLQIIEWCFHFNTICRVGTNSTTTYSIYLNSTMVSLRPLFWSHSFIKFWKKAQNWAYNSFLKRCYHYCCNIPVHPTRQISAQRFLQFFRFRATSILRR